MVPLCCRLLLMGVALWVASDQAAAQTPNTEANEPLPRLSPKDLAAWIDARFEALPGDSAATSRPLIDDATFLRRASLDLLGAIPSVSGTRDFLADESAYKRDQFVVGVLGLAGEQTRLTDRNAAHLARVWRRILVPGNGPGAMMATRLDPWLKQQFAANVPYDELARSLVLARPQTTNAPPDTTPVNIRPTEGPLVLYEAIGPTPENLANSFAQTFLGVRIGCAQCHDHPFASWKQQDFWGMAAFFVGNTRGPNGEWTETKVTRIRDQAGDAEYDARFLWGDVPDFAGDRLPREVFAEWLTSPRNPNFAATAVNRVWQYLCGRGLTDAVDDLDTASPEERAILDDLAKQFAAADFDLRWLMAGICLSRTYQRACVSLEADAGELPPGARPVKTLLPEQVFDSLEQALALPVSRADEGPRYNGQMNELITRLNEALGTRPDDFRGGIPQTLLLMNGQLIARATDLGQSRTLRAVVEAPFLDDAQKLETLYLAAFTRLPRPEEREFLLQHIRAEAEAGRQKEAYAEIFWGLLNSPEFVLMR
jgi:hypothetical protein